MIDIWLDDVRDPPNNGLNWIHVRTAPHCIELLARSAGIVETLSLDHDLGEIPDATGHEGTGYDVALWLERAHFLGDHKMIPRWVLCHSANPVGRARILQAIAKFKPKP